MAPPFFVGWYATKPGVMLEGTAIEPLPAVEPSLRHPSAVPSVQPSYLLVTHEERKVIGTLAQHACNGPSDQLVIFATSHVIECTPRSPSPIHQSENSFTRRPSVMSCINDSRLEASVVTFSNSGSTPCTTAPDRRLNAMNW